MRDNLSNPADDLRDGPQEAAEFVEAVPAQPAVAANDRIAQRAYELYQGSGGAEGDDWTDWLQAEAEVNAALGASEVDDESVDDAAGEDAPLQTSASIVSRS